MPSSIANSWGMDDLLSFSIPSDKVMSGRFRVHAVTGDAMEPSLRGGRDYVLAAPVDTYQGEGVYLMDVGFGADLFHVSSTLTKELRLSRDNPRYAAQIFDREAFDERVMGIVVADIRTRNERFLRGA